MTDIKIINDMRKWVEDHKSEADLFELVKRADDIFREFLNIPKE